MKQIPDYKIESEIERIRNWLIHYMTEAEKDTFVIGVSGGIDSAVVERLCEVATFSIFAINMPMHPTETSIIPSSQRAYELCKDRPEDVHYKVRTIERIIKSYKTQGIANNRLNEGNLRARIRANILYDFAANNNGIVVGTGNKDEDEIGYMTKFGDGAVDICPLSNIHKSAVYQMGKFLEVPQSILDAAPTAELWDGQTDEQELGLTYDQVEWAIKILDDLHNNLASLKEIDETEFLILQKVQLMRKKNSHKLKYPPIYNPTWCV